MNIVKLAAKIDPVQLAVMLDGQICAGWINIRGPGHSWNDYSLGFRLNSNAPGGLIVHSFANDDPTVCRKYVKDKLQELLKSARVPLQVGNRVERPTNSSDSFACRLWTEGQPIEGTPAAVYLKSRDCAPAAGASWPEDLRFHPACPFSTYRFPALIGLMRDLITGEPAGIHRTALGDDGSSKRVMPGGLQPKMMLGRARGAAVQLHSAGTCLGLAEGIETALSAQKIFKVPVWAALSASGIGSLPVIHGLSRLFVFADNDGPGLAGARRCRRIYRGAGIEARIQFPSEHGTDCNDYLQRG